MRVPCLSVRHLWLYASVVWGLLLIQALPASSQPACTHYASPTGTLATGCGSSSGPYCGVQQWIDGTNHAANRGQVLCLLDGTYGTFSTDWAESGGTFGTWETGSEYESCPNGRTTIRALNDGGAWVRGNRVQLWGNCGWAWGFDVEATGPGGSTSGLSLSG